MSLIIEDYIPELLVLMLSVQIVLEFVRRIPANCVHAFNGAFIMFMSSQVRQILHQFEFDDIILGRMIWLMCRMSAILETTNVVLSGCYFHQCHMTIAVCSRDSNSYTCQLLRRRCLDHCLSVATR